ncbi:hypothetical protein FACS189460_4400 [Deltaproteobacteria bacterium]|nr:hypothetical protein FACS189460_4400 [Deltaproteobacteria bacterium]
MKIAVMQPYFLPYLGYWQLLAAVDAFVILDDVNYITRGFINRNYLLLSGRPHLFSIPLENPSQNRLIKETKLNFSGYARDKLLKTIAAAYKKAPEFEAVFPLLEKIILFPETDLTGYIAHSITAIRRHVGLKTEIYVSSELKQRPGLKAQAKIIDLCANLGAETYINPPGGWDLYDPTEFRARGLALKFLRPGQVAYRQFNHEFVPNLSFLDVMMFNKLGPIENFLQEYALDEKN